ncbi:MAG: hypothetical protein C0506_10820 [Anaerolinea sp.]|nr:hypothetical protein [Anaerolinea sp.]
MLTLEVRYGGERLLPAGRFTTSAKGILRTLTVAELPPPAPSHDLNDGHLHDGVPSGLVTSRGARRNGIEHTKDGFVTRGVLLDVPGKKWLDPGYPITIAELEECAMREGVSVGSGDALLVRTGHQALCREAGSWAGYAGGGAAGTPLETTRWLHGHEVCAIAIDALPWRCGPNEPANALQPLHMVLIRDMGMSVDEISYLDHLADDCAEDGVWEFMFVAPSLPFTSASGSPANPIAVK